ncbi:AMP-dependent synthetase [Phyllobacterium phragmitis]|uniref:AMP-dependent synthetase n=1 Tax=Phyllobacterium phragmitis TaxID=2670329 RepID=A0A2S9IST0_9HYPH|nr:AMP-binding protein [Phyllobacterium phragmitis]PRD43578.1 AMP-dependent synthetase [Phyllobacterium phragmitis]
MIDGSMQSFPLTVEKFIQHGARWNPEVEVVTALADGSTRRIRYDALHDRARRLSGVLSQLGVGLRDRVATLAWNTADHVEVWYGIMGMGAICHTLNPRLGLADLAAMLRQSEPEILVVSADLQPLARQLAAACACLRHILVIDGPCDCSPCNIDVTLLDYLLEGDVADVPWGQFDETSPSGLCFTSGTTGAPKGVTYTHRSSFLHTLRLLQADIFAISRRDTVLAVVPMFHANAWGLPFAAPAVGARLVLPGRVSDGAGLARLINEENVTLAVGVPTLWLGLVEHLEIHGGNVPTLERVLVGGAPLPPALMRRIEERLGVTAQTSWGMTELSPSGTVAFPGDPERRADLLGRPAIGVDLLLTDAGGTALPEQRDIEGHLRVRGAAVVERYFGQDEPATDRDGWFATGDLARIDRDGNLTITGRAKDLIKSGGEWINPAEIEAIIGALPDVSLAAVIGRPDLKWGERPLLLVEMRRDREVRDEDLLASLKGRVASWWIPDRVVRLEAMPKAATGKIDKVKLRAEHGQA